MMLLLFDDVADAGGGAEPLDPNEFFLTATEGGVTYDLTATEADITYDLSATEA